VYVNLEATPYVVYTDPAQGFVLHTGEPISAIDGVWLTETGQLLLKSGDKIALLDDRDIAQCISRLRIDDAAVEDERLLDWLNHEGSSGSLTLQHDGRQIPVQRIVLGTIAEYFGFVPAPRPDAV
jgi:hypothetical protein